MTSIRSTACCAVAQIFGGDDGDDFAVEPNFVDRHERLIFGQFEVLVSRQRPQRMKISQMIAMQHADNTGQSFRFAGIDGNDLRVRIWTRQHRTVEQVRRARGDLRYILRCRLLSGACRCAGASVNAPSFPVLADIGSDSSRYLSVAYLLRPVPFVPRAETLSSTISLIGIGRVIPNEFRKPSMTTRRPSSGMFAS